MEPRIGAGFQADVPDFAPAARPVDSLSAQVVWQPSRIPKPESLEAYLDFVKGLFDEKEELGNELYDEERALRFLHQCDYDVEAAMELLRPFEPEEEEDEEDQEWFNDDFCFVCREGGDIMLCDSPGCRRVFHPACLKLEKVPEGHWSCPFHFCTVCNEPATNLRNWCSRCPTAYCDKHLPEEISKKSEELGLFEFLCLPCCEKEAAASTGRAGRNRRDFMRRLHAVWKKDGRTVERIPHIGQQELDLPALYKEVCNQGGFVRVVKNGMWPDIKRVLNVPTTVSNTVNLLKKHYFELLYPYEKSFFADTTVVDARMLTRDSDFAGLVSPDDYDEKGKRRKKKESSRPGKNLPFTASMRLATGMGPAQNRGGGFMSRAGKPSRKGKGGKGRGKGRKGPAVMGGSEEDEDDDDDASDYEPDRPKSSRRAKTTRKRPRKEEREDSSEDSEAEEEEAAGSRKRTGRQRGRAKKARRTDEEKTTTGAGRRSPARSPRAAASDAWDA